MLDISPLDGIRSPFGQRRGGSGPAPAFSPTSLYSSGSQGIWLDPSDLSTMFSDRAGTTPVTTPGTVVGLRLDKSKGLVLGSELVTLSALGATSEWSFGGGVWTLASSTTNSQILSFGSLVVGNTYRISVTVTALSSGTLTFRHPNSSTIVPGAPTITSAGTYTFYLQSTVALVYLRNSTTGQTATVSDFSVRELPGNHAVATTDAARPIYGVEPKGGRRNLLTWSEDSGNAVWVKTNVTVATEATTAPDGTTTADKIVQNTGAGGYIDQSVNISNATAYTFSAYAKQAGYRYVELTGDAASGRIPASAYFDLQNGVVSSNPSGTADIVSVGSGWFRCSISATSTATGARPFFRASTNGTSPATGNGTDGVFIWGAQLERDA